MQKILVIIITTICLINGYSCKKDKNDNNNPPSTPCNPNPNDGSTINTLSPTLSWSCIDPDVGDNIIYTVYLSIINPPNDIISFNDPLDYINLSGLSANQIYYWRVYTKDSKGAVTISPVWRFTTADIRGNICGNIIDYLTDNVLQGVKIYTQPISDSTYSDVSGHYLLTNIKAGNYTICAFESGYNQVCKDIIINGNDTIIANFQLGGGLHSSKSYLHANLFGQIDYCTISGGNENYSIYQSPTIGNVVLLDNYLYFGPDNSHNIGVSQVVIKDSSTIPYTVKIQTCVYPN